MSYDDEELKQLVEKGHGTCPVILQIDPGGSHGYSPLTGTEATHYVPDRMDRGDVYQEEEIEELHQDGYFEMDELMPCFLLYC